MSFLIAATADMRNATPEEVKFDFFITC